VKTGRFPPAVLSVWVLASIGSTVQAQGERTESEAPATTIAVIDVRYAFEQYAGFQQRRRRMQEELKAAEAQLNSQRQRLNERARELRSVNPEHPSFGRREASFARQVAQLQIQIKQKKKEFLEQEAQLYYAAYMEIQTAMRQVTARYNIRLVLQYDRRDIDSRNPQAVAIAMNRMVLYQRQMDITDLVLSELNLYIASKSPSSSPRR